MGFLTDLESSSLRMARISLHIVGGEDEFEPQPELSVEHDDFLLQSLREIASDSVYSFAEVSRTRTLLEAIATRQVGFQDGAPRAVVGSRLNRAQYPLLTAKP